MSYFALGVWLVALTLALPAHEERLFAESARLEWTAATGPVYVYAVYVQPPGTAPQFFGPALPAGMPTAIIDYAYGIVVAARVRGVEENGVEGPISDESLPMAIYPDMDYTGDGYVGGGDFAQLVLHHFSGVNFSLFRKLFGRRLVAGPNGGLEYLQ